MAPPEEGTFPANLSQADPRTARKLEERPTDPKSSSLGRIALSGMMPYMLVIIVCMVIMYLWPGMTLWLPNYLYGG